MFEIILPAVLIIVVVCIAMWYMNRSAEKREVESSDDSFDFNDYSIVGEPVLSILRALESRPNSFSFTSAPYTLPYTLVLYDRVTKITIGHFGHITPFGYVTRIEFIMLRHYICKAYREKEVRVRNKLTARRTLQKERKHERQQLLRDKVAEAYANSAVFVDN